MLINGEFVDDALVRLETPAIKERLRIEDPVADSLAIELKARDMAREMVIERVILRQAAQQDSAPIPDGLIDAALKQSGCLLPRDQEAMRADIETELRIKRLLARVTANVPKPPAKRIAAFYEYAKRSLVEPERVRVAHIVKNVDELNSEEQALAAIRHVDELLRGGARFEEVADAHSDCPGNGGELGFIARGEMVDEFETVVFALSVGEVSGVFRTPFGFHIAKVYERKPERTPSLNEMRPRLEESMWMEMKNEVVLDFLTGLRERAEIRRTR
jgi:parvulin-like peptidyl-prolyl isomerase